MVEGINVYLQYVQSVNWLHIIRQYLNLLISWCLLIAVAYKGLSSLWFCELSLVFGSALAGWANKVVYALRNPAEFF